MRRIVEASAVAPELQAAPRVGPYEAVPTSHLVEHIIKLFKLAFWGEGDTPTAVFCAPTVGGGVKACVAFVKPDGRLAFRRTVRGRTRAIALDELRRNVRVALDGRLAAMAEAQAADDLLAESEAAQ